MSTQNISSAALHVVGQYNEAGKTLVGAYRTGVQRLLDGAAARTGAFLGERQLPPVGEKVNGFLAHRLDVDTGRVVAVMDRVAAGTSSGIASVANAAGRIESPLGTSVLQALGSLHQPFAAVSVQIAGRIAAGARQIESRGAGTTAEAAPVKTVRAKAKPAVRRTVRTARKA